MRFPISIHQIETLRTLRWKYLVILAALLVSALIGLRSYQLVQPTGILFPRWAFLFFGVLGAGLVGLLALRSMSIALTLLVSISVVLNISLSTGTQSQVNATIILVALLTAVWIIRMLVSEKRIWLVPSPLNNPLLAFLLVFILAWLAGYAIKDEQVSFPGNAFQVQAGQFAMFALSVAALFLTANHAFEEKTLQSWTWIILILGIAAISSDILKIQPQPLPAVKGAMQMWPFVLLFAHLLFNPDLKPEFRLFGWPLLGLWAYWVYYTPTFNTKGLWVPALLAMGLLLALRSLKLSVLTGVVVLVLLHSTGAFDALLAAESASSYRPLIWQDVLHMASKNWLLGLGPANYMYYWPSLGLNSLTLQQAIQNQPWMAQQWGTYIVVPSHNMYVDILAQSGVFGLIIFLVFLILALRFGWRLSLRFQPGFYKAHILGVLCGFAAMAIGSFWFADWLIPFVYNITISGFRHSVYSWLLLGTLVSINYFSEDVQIERSP
jgi:hypothetical protein